MLGEQRYTKRPVNYTYPEEEAMWHDDHPAPRSNSIGLSKQDQFSIIQNQFGEEFKEFKDFLDGKLDVPAEIYFKMMDKKLFYIEYPDLFVRDVSIIETCHGENLSPSDEAWIKNTHELVGKYSAICLQEQIKIWPEMAAGGTE